MSLEVDIEKKLKDMTLKVSFQTGRSGQITGILGASGCGKSMTLKCIAGIEKPDRGRIVLNGRVLFDSEQKINIKIQERKAGYLFQNYALFPNMTVRENIGVSFHGRKEERKALVDDYMELFHIGEIAQCYPKRLSGGQQQRVALARILASKPEILMLDEPFSALDTFLKEKLQLELFHILKKYDGETILVTHNRDEIYRFCGHIHILEQGREVAAGKTSEVFENPGVLAAAKLTGCKNLVKIEHLSSHKIYVPEWNTELQFKKQIPSDADYIGIRAHYLRAKEENDSINIVECHQEEIVEEPFEVTIVMKNGIWWKLQKSQWNSIFHCTAPDKLVIPEESVLFLKE